ncbi:MnhB domain-containing protein [Archangium violaceum]|uniref:MnhB domain-containing protein n=1 Tax=Archangium violaceum TaxID=83451 RepID=UPI00193B99BA|nr:MnhB domain-containing protein [Archangium violaceum]QRK05918.1 MnhB domain-containing protein [Archangium violaceum]
MHSFVPLIARVLLQPALVVAAALWVRGYAEAGGGFSAGVLAALAVLLQYVVLGREEARRPWPVRHAAALVPAGLMVVLAVAFGPVLAGYPPVTHFPRPGEHVVHLGALELHTAALFDVGIFLLVFGFIVATIDGIIAAVPEEEDAS